MRDEARGGYGLYVLTMDETFLSEISVWELMYVRHGGNDKARC